MNILRHTLLALALFSFFSCKKAGTNAEPDPAFELLVQNNFSEIQAKYALFLSDAEGETVAFRWLPSEGIARIMVLGSKPEDHFDCTVVKVATLEDNGTGVTDTTLTLTTYTNLSSGQQINLRDLYFHQVTTMSFMLTGFTTLDSIVVSDGLALSRPQANNNYSGVYLVNNTGRCWMRVLINGEHFWRYLTFDNVGETLEVNTIDLSILLLNLSPPFPIQFPFVSTWQYKLDAAVDTSQLKFFPLSQHIRAPGGPIPVYDFDQIFEPVNNDLFEPNRPYTELFRLQTTGPTSASSGYTYLSDNFYPAVPASLPEPTFNLEPTNTANNRFVAVHCIGDFDLLAFARTRTGTPNIFWEVITKPEPGIVIYRLPDVPSPLGDLYPSLKNYGFNNSVRARAERYERLNYENALQSRLINADPLWQARGGYLGREENY